MKKILLLFLALFAISLYSQTYKTVTIIQQTTKTLNSGGRSWVGGVSRIPLRVDLPANTVEWYYSFTTSSGESATSLLNLAIQVGAYASTGPLGATVAKGLKVPPGSGSVDVWLMPIDSKANFDAKKDDQVKYFPDLSEVNTKQSVKKINNLLTGSYYLGLRNPSALNVITIIIEVVAVVKEDNPEEEKGKLYGTMGWKAYERGELDKCVELSNKALTFNPNLAWVKFNIALVHLVQEKDQCVDEYVDAIATCKKDPNPKNALIGALDDINNLKKTKPSPNYMTDIETLIKNALINY